MKRIASGITALLLTTGAWASEYWIQVLSIGVKRTMEADFLKRLEASGHAYETVLEEGQLKVRIGDLASYEAAAKLLPEVRRKVTPDAFIVKAEVQDPAVETVPRGLAMIPNPRATKQTHAAAVETPPAAPSLTEKPSAPEAAEVVAETTPKMPDETATAAAVAPCVCLYDKHALRKAEIAAALSYYKNSPYHRFGTMDQGWFAK